MLRCWSRTSFLIKTCRAGAYSHQQQGQPGGYGAPPCPGGQFGSYTQPGAYSQPGFGQLHTLSPAHTHSRGSDSNRALGMHSKSLVSNRASGVHSRDLGSSPAFRLHSRGSGSSLRTPASSLKLLEFLSSNSSMVSRHDPCLRSTPRRPVSAAKLHSRACHRAGEALSFGYILATAAVRTCSHCIRCPDFV